MHKPREHVVPMFKVVVVIAAVVFVGVLIADMLSCARG